VRYHPEDLESPEQWDLNAASNVPRFIWPTQKSKRQGEKVLVMVNTLEMRWNMGIDKQ